VALWIGTSGWQYKDWKGRFYPSDVAQKHWLRFYAERFRTVEVNNTFYRLPEADTFKNWHDGSPDDFVFVTKMSRYLTHIKRLSEPEEPVERFLDHAAPLGKKLGPVLVQLPPNLPADDERLGRLLEVWPSKPRLAIEFRHESWFTDATLARLRERNVALCLTDRLGRPQEPVERTAHWGYIRLHEGRADPPPCYGDGALGSWLERIGGRWRDDESVYVFFNNDPGACAVHNAARFAELADRAGMTTTRTPDRRDVAVG
jgi:uncharacterized protein YecE (DUF72 family)